MHTVKRNKPFFGIAAKNGFICYAKVMVWI